MVSSSAATVPEYLASLPPERRRVVAAMRRFARQLLPKGHREAMRYGMVACEVPLRVHPDTCNGRPLVCVALGRRPDMGKSCLRFSSMEELPLEAIGREIESAPPADFIRRHEASRA